MPEPDVLLNDGDDIDLPGRRLRVVWTPGHTPGHICLHDADHDLLLTGDHLLPRITPNIGLAPGGPGSPLHGYLASLRRLRGYDSAEALPAHEYRFRGIAAGPRTRSPPTTPIARTRSSAVIASPTGRRSGRSPSG